MQNYLNERIVFGNNATVPDGRASWRRNELTENSKFETNYAIRQNTRKIQISSAGLQPSQPPTNSSRTAETSMPGLVQIVPPVCALPGIFAEHRAAIARITDPATCDSLNADSQSFSISADIQSSGELRQLRVQWSTIRLAASLLPSHAAPSSRLKVAPIRMLSTITIRPIDHFSHPITH